MDDSPSFLLSLSGYSYCAALSSGCLNLLQNSTQGRLTLSVYDGGGESAVRRLEPEEIQGDGHQRHLA